ncbi:MAG TPA: Na-translocating system protein MpsC family protein [Solirubrobacterales bacterium]
MDSDRSVGEVLSAITDGLVSLHTRSYGKGPTSAKTYYMGDAVVTFLWDGFTKVEETLIATGRGETVALLRRSLQTAMEEEFTAIVEEATGRSVIAFLSQVHMDPNMAADIFLLAPEAPAPGPGGDVR